MAMIKEQSDQETEKLYTNIQNKDDDSIRKIIFSYLQLEKQKEQIIPLVEKENNANSPLVGIPIAASCGVLPACNTASSRDYEMGSQQAVGYSTQFRNKEASAEATTFNQEKTEGTPPFQNEEETKEGVVTIVSSFTAKEVNKEIQDFVSYFNERYKTLERLLRGRQELDNVTVVKRALQKEEREPVAVIGLVKKIEETKNNNIIIALEYNT